MPVVKSKADKASANPRAKAKAGQVTSKKASPPQAWQAQKRRKSRFDSKK